MDYVQIMVAMFAYLFFIRNEYDGHTKQGHSLFASSLSRGVKLRKYYNLCYYHHVGPCIGSLWSQLSNKLSINCPCRIAPVGLQFSVMSGLLQNEVQNFG